MWIQSEFKDSSVSEFLSKLSGACTEYLKLLVTYLGFIWEDTAQLEAFSIILTKVCSNVKSTYKTRKNVYVANYNHLCATQSKIQVIILTTPVIISLIKDENSVLWNIGSDSISIIRQIYNMLW